MSTDHEQDYPFDQSNPFTTTEQFEPGVPRTLPPHQAAILGKPEESEWPGRREEVTHDMLAERANGNIAPYSMEEVKSAIWANDRTHADLRAAGVGDGVEVYHFHGKDGTFVSESTSPATLWLPDEPIDVINDLHKATVRYQVELEKFAQAREEGRDPGQPPRHVFQELVERSREREELARQREQEIIAEREYSGTPQPEFSLASSRALCNLIDSCERAIQAEEKSYNHAYSAAADHNNNSPWVGTDRNPYMDYPSVPKWVEPMKEALGEVRAERQQEIDEWLRQERKPREQAREHELEPEHTREVEIAPIGLDLER